MTAVEDVAKSVKKLDRFCRSETDKMQSKTILLFTALTTHFATTNKIFLRFFNQKP